MSSPVTIMPERPRRRWIWIAIAVATAVAVIVPATALAVDAGSGEVTVRRGPAGVVRVQRYLTWALAGSQPRVRQVWDGGTLQISLGSCRAGSTSPRWPIRLVDLGTCDVHVTIEVPADVSVRVLATSGDVDVRGMTGDLHVQTASGDISVVDVSGPVWVRTISGDISAAAPASPRVDAGLASGDIRLVFADAPRRERDGYLRRRGDHGTAGSPLPGERPYRLRQPGG
jgi:hypothetical protein